MLRKKSVHPLSHFLQCHSRSPPLGKEGACRCPQTRDRRDLETPTRLPKSQRGPAHSTAQMSVSAHCVNGPSTTGRARLLLPLLGCPGMQQYQRSRALPAILACHLLLLPSELSSYCSEQLIKQPAEYYALRCKSLGRAPSVLQFSRGS